MQPTTLQQTLSTLLNSFRKHRRLWMIPAVTLTLAAAAYALVRPTNWKASQALLVRDEAVGTDNRRGRFASIDSMKAFQETVLEVARSPVVVTGALRQLDRSGNAQKPTDREVHSFQRKIDITAPKGSEFGSTEVIYLSVLGSTREEAIQRARAVCDQLEKHLASLRNARAASVFSEQEETLKLALAGLDEATRELQTMEHNVGSDLAELRVMNQSGAGEGNLRLALNQVKAELRQARSTLEEQQQQCEFLKRAKDNPDELLATPTRLLDAQPALRRLKDGLVDAQLRTSELRGRMSPEHPLVQSALRAEDQVRKSLRDEVDAALLGLAADSEVSGQRVDSLQQQHDELSKRLDRLANLRASYAVLVDSVQQQTEIVERAKKDLSDARASQSAAQSASLITRFQEPQAGDAPVGPGRLTIVAAGLFGGLVTGAGLVFLVSPIGATQRGRRWTDYLAFGRRSADRLPAAGNTNILSTPVVRGRRAEDRVASSDERRQLNRRAEDRQLRDRSNEEPKSPPDNTPAERAAK